MNKYQLKDQQVKAAIRECFSKRPFSIKDCGCSYREVLYWEQKGLLPFPTSDHKWKKFNLAELTWLRLIRRLRQFDVGVPIIKEIKESCFKLLSTEEVLSREEELFAIVRGIVGSDFDKLDKSALDAVSQFVKEKIRIPQFESWLIQMLADSVAFYLLIRVDKINGQVDVKPILIPPGQCDMPIDILDELLSADNICIQINQLFEDLLSISDSKKFADVYGLTEKELQIFDLLRTGKYTEISIKMDKDSPKMIYGKERIPVKNGITLTDMINRRGYHSIEVITQDGKVVAIERETRIKL
jgi:DNA-binding transcriptional MerR regulator